MAAGDWNSGAGLGDANISVAARTLQNALHASVKNIEPIGHPVFQSMLAKDAELGQLMGALGVSVSLAAIGQGKLAAVAEGTEATPTNFSTANSTTVTPGRRAFARDVSDFARSLQEPLLRGELSPTAEAMLTYEAYRLWSNDLVDRVVALAASASTEMGTTGTALTWSDIQSGVMTSKNRGVQGRGIGMLSTKGALDLTSNALSLSGAVQFRGRTQDMVANAEGGAYLFSEWGVDWFLNSELDADGGDTLGIVLWDGAVLLKHQRVPLPSEAETMLDLGFLTVEKRRPGGGQTRFETVSYNALGILEAARFDAVRYVTA